jgi:hypothetical protein
MSQLRALGKHRVAGLFSALEPFADAAPLRWNLLEVPSSQGVPWGDVAQRAIQGARDRLAKLATAPRVTLHQWMGQAKDVTRYAQHFSGWRPFLYPMPLEDEWVVDYPLEAPIPYFNRGLKAHINGVHVQGRGGSVAGRTYSRNEEDLHGR